MKQHTLNGHSFSRVGLGCMGMSWAYGPADAQDGHATLCRALELGVNHWDTADLYGGGENEKLLAPILKDHRDEVFLATKFGNVYDRTLTTHQDQVEANAPWIVDGTPRYANLSIDLSLSKLGVEQVDLYYLHRVDAKTPIEETVGTMAEMVKAGKVKNLGLSEASVDTIRRAHAVHPIAAVQSELSIWTPDYLKDVVPLCAELGITFVAYSPLGRGFLTGKYKSVEDFAPEDWRRSNPRFAEQAFAENLAIVAGVEKVAERHGAKASQVALAWVLAQGDHVVVIPGTKRVHYLEENAAADNLTLTDEDLAELNSLPVPNGDRYPGFFMDSLNL